METVREIEKAIMKLPPDDLSKLAEWFEEFESEQWDEQIASDLKSGKLKELIDEAEFAMKNGDAKPL